MEIEEMFDDLDADSVSLVKKDGSLIKEQISASVQANKMYIYDVNLPIEVGDHILRILPSGLNEDYEVTQANFHNGGDLSHWELTTRRGREPLATVTTIINNISGSNARINIDSTDNSTNHYGMEIDSTISSLIDSIKSQVSSQSEQIALILAVNKLSEKRGSGEYNIAYQKLIESFANHMTILAPFLPALAQLL